MFNFYSIVTNAVKFIHQILQQLQDLLLTTQVITRFIRFYGE